MCRRVTCQQCGRPTYAGCGQHIEQVLGDVPVADRCHCNDAPKQSPSPGGSVPPKRSWLAALFGR